MARPSWSMTEAVERTDASRSTLRRYLADGKFPNAFQDSRTKAWRFPLEDLLAAGLSVAEPASERVLGVASEQAASVVDERVSQLEQALAVERARADGAERLAASYQENVQDLRRALLMLGAGASQHEPSSGAALSVSTEPVIEPAPAATADAVSKREPVFLDTPKGTPQGAPLWRRIFSRR